METGVLLSPPLAQRMSEHRENNTSFAIPLGRPIGSPTPGSFRRLLFLAGMDTTLSLSGLDDPPYAL